MAPKPLPEEWGTVKYSLRAQDPSQAAWTAHEAVSLFRVAGDKGPPGG